MGKENTRILPPEKISVTAMSNPFGVSSVVHYFDEGASLSDILLNACPELINYSPVVFIGDNRINPSFYHLVKPKSGQVVSIKALPLGGGGGGGKNPLRTVLSLALLAAAPYASTAILGQSLASTTILGSLTYGKILGGALSLAGNLIINALVPPATPKASNFQASNSSVSNKEDVSQTYFIQGARNQLNPFGGVPEVLGTHRVTPPLAAQPYNEVTGEKVYSRQMFAISNGKIDVSEEKIGDTLLSEYEGVTEENFYDANIDDKSDIVPDIVTQNTLNIEAVRGEFTIVQTTAIDTDEIDIETTYPEGLAYYTTDGQKFTHASRVFVQYRPTGTTEWSSSLSLGASNETTAAFSTQISFKPTQGRGQYDVRVQNDTSLNPTYDPNDSTARTQNRIRDKVVWTALRSYKNESPVNATGISGKALRILGTNQLNGQIDDYNVIASQKISDWNGSEWVAEQITSNPASIFLHILKSSKAKKQIPDERIDYSSIQDWHDYCAEKEFEYNAYIDYDADREALLKEVAAAGLAVPVLVDNKYKVVIDRENPVISQHITQRNSFDYSYEKTFKELPHAIRIPFINRDKDYLQDQIIVYDDGYDFTNATRFDTLDFPGVVTSSHNYKLGRHRIAESRLRPDMHKVTMDIENIVATKGDRVKLSHDVSLIGLKAGRVKSVIDNGTHVTAVVVDEPVLMTTGNLYSAEFRLRNNTNLKVSITTVNDEVNTLTFNTPILIASAPRAGDLFSFGFSDSVTVDCLVHSVNPISDYNAEIRLIEYNEAIYQASEGTIPDYDNNITLPAEFTRPLPPSLISIQSDEFAQIRNIDGSISSRMIINLKNLNAFSVTPTVFIKEINETDFHQAQTVELTPNRVVLENLDQGKVYDINIYYVRQGGSQLSSSIVSAPLQINGETFIGEGSPPPNVENFDITVRGETVRLTWSQVNVVDLDRYELRFSPLTSGADWQSGLPLDSNISKDTTSTNVPSAIGTYMIKAVDKQGNYSVNETLVVTTVGKLLNLNLVSTINESSTWGGTFDGTVNNAGILELGGSDTIDDWTDIDSISSWDYGNAGLANSGIYYFEDTQDLGAVYDNVLSVNITVSGRNVNDRIDEWSSFDDREDFDGTTPSQYSVVLQVRTTNDNPLSSPTWSSWAPLRPLGEYTARAFEFRLILTALVSDVTPSVSFFTLTIDMPGRLESEENISSGTSKKSVVFPESFRATPVVGISADDMQTGDYFLKNNVTATGFDIEFFNSSAANVDRTFSYIAKGYGRT